MVDGIPPGKKSHAASREEKFLNIHEQQDHLVAFGGIIFFFLTANVLYVMGLNNWLKQSNKMN